MMSTTFDEPGAAADTIGRSVTRTGSVPPALAGMLSAALSHDASPTPKLESGAPLPYLWHWAAFPEFPAMSALGSDGHPKTGDFLPHLPFPRRMWAGGDVRFYGTLHIDEPLTRTSTIRAVSQKEGKTGPMAFVTVEHTITGAEGGRVEEVQDIVYLDIPPEFRPPRPMPLPEKLLYDETVEMNEVRLFRYSAATFNGHRIHYDLPYAREVEKYPALVVHGPMQATLALEAAQRNSGRRATRFRYRGVYPMFHDHSLRLVGAADPDGNRFVVGTASPDGHFGQSAIMEFTA